jgi:hypothetical protein
MPGALAEAVRRAARRQVPRAPSDLEEEVVRCLGGGLVGRIMECLAGWSKLERGVEWSVSWPSAGGDATVVHGRAEFLVRDGDGVWSVVTVSPPGATPALERLRWVLSARAAADRGLAPLGSGWRVVLDEQGDFRREERFDDAAVEAALRSALESIGRG